MSVPDGAYGGRSKMKLNKEICKRCCQDFKWGCWDSYAENRWDKERVVWCPVGSYAPDVKHAVHIDIGIEECLYRLEQLVMK